MSTAATDSSHFVPRFLLKGWRTREGAEDAWVFDPITGITAEVRFEDLCCEEDDAAVNDIWNDLVETPAFPVVRGLRTQTAPATKEWPALKEIEGLAPKTLDAFFHLFWSLRSRNPDTPRAWGGLTQREYVEQLKNPGPMLPELIGKYRLAALWLKPTAASKFVLTDWTAFPLPPIRGCCVLCLPIDPQRAILMVEKRISLNELRQTLALLPLGEVSHGSPATKVLLPPEGMDNQQQRDAAVQLIKSNVPKWRPKIFTWALQVVL
jgi:hypothetical protein